MEIPTVHAYLRARGSEAPRVRLFFRYSSEVVPQRCILVNHESGPIRASAFSQQSRGGRVIVAVS
jgi:hypothetical protein